MTGRVHFADVLSVVCVNSLWVQQNIHIVIIVLYYNSGCQEPPQQAQRQAGVQWNHREIACYETLYGAKSMWVQKAQTDSTGVRERKVTKGHARESEREQDKAARQARWQVTRVRVPTQRAWLEPGSHKKLRESGDASTPVFSRDVFKYKRDW